MDRAEICKHINDGADLSLRVLGDAKHMEYSKNAYYSVIRPKRGEKGGASVFAVKLENLSDEELQQKVDEILRLEMHVWWGFFLSERVLDAIWKDRQRPAPLPEPNDDEVAMAMLPEEKPVYAHAKTPITVKRVDGPELFQVWTAINNEVLGFPIMHPQNHYHLCEKGIMTCYLGLYDATPACVAAILTEEDISSLEFVGTLEGYRRKGLAREVSITAIDEAFANGSKILSLRPLGPAKKLYHSLGFTVY